MKLKRFFKQIMPSREFFQAHPRFAAFGHILEDPDIFHLTRRSAAGGVASGLFIGFLPIPGHMICAALFAIVARVNMPLCVVATLVTNPLTMGPVFYLAYRTGARLLDHPVHETQFQISWEWFGGTFMNIWPALLTGSLLFAIVSASVGYLVIRVLWRLAVLSKWKERRAARKR